MSGRGPVVKLNIPSYKTDDANYRYKMPRLEVNQEARGNGKKTRLTNIDQVAQSLRCRPEYPTKWYINCFFGNYVFFFYFPLIFLFFDLSCFFFFVFEFYGF